MLTAASAHVTVIKTIVVIRNVGQHRTCTGMTKMIKTSTNTAIRIATQIDTHDHPFPGPTRMKVRYNTPAVIPIALPL